MNCLLLFHFYLLKSTLDMAFWAILDIVILYLDFYFHVKRSKMSVYREHVMYGNTDCVKKKCEDNPQFSVLQVEIHIRSA